MKKGNDEMKKGMVDTGVGQPSIDIEAVQQRLGGAIINARGMEGPCKDCEFKETGSTGYICTAGCAKRSKYII